MSWQEEIKGKTLREAVDWYLAHVLDDVGPLLDHEIYEDVPKPWPGRPDIHMVRLHRVWAARQRSDGSTFVYCADIEEYDDNPGEPFFAAGIIGLEERPWGVRPPRGFGKPGRRGGKTS